MADADIVIVGGGLAGGLCALALQRRCPQLQVRLLEQDERLGGNHRWSFFDSDLDSAGKALLAGLDCTRWPENEIRFPLRQRILQTGYNSLSSDSFDRWLRAELAPGALRLGKAVASLEQNLVWLQSGETITARLVLDARGPQAGTGLEVGWQKFAGFDLLVPGHGLARPIIMDACVDQADGYRFVYVLPLSKDRLFIEDTYYSLDPGLDVPVLRAGMRDYAARFGTVMGEEGHETGVLPIVIAGDPQAFWPAGDPVARVGMAGGFFHHTTGYSLPFALRNALDFADHCAGGTLPDAAWWRSRFLKDWHAQGYFRLLNRMLFHAAPPAQRYRVFEHFYRLPQGLIERFYGARLKGSDRLRILTGRPPVKISSAIAALAGRKGPA